MQSLDYVIFIITNQAGISEGKLTEEEFWDIHSVVIDRLATSGVHIRKTYMCPHGPSDNRECRKPKPTLLLRAAQEFDINLKESWTVGDHDSDIQAGKRAGTKTILVETANRKEPPTDADFRAHTFLDAIKHIAQLSR